MRELLSFYNGFYANTTKIQQDNFIIKYCEVQSRKRSRIENSKRTRTFKYFIRNSSGTKVSVCRDTFLRVLLIRKDRLQGVLTRHYNNRGQLATEGRGGDRHNEKNTAKREAVAHFIESLNCSEGHYCRGKSTARVYLPPELNIKRLWNMYLSVEGNPKVKECFFRHVFNTSYNIGFGSPSSDVCSKCLEYRERLKKETDEEEKSKIFTEKKVHKLKASAFYELLREEKCGMITMSFDCQKNMALPKLPDSSAYFSSQLNLYNFAIVVGNSKSKLSKENVFCYHWCENERQKGSNEIASAVYHRLCNTDFKGVHTLRLVADGCGGQNKNRTLMYMLMKWLNSDSYAHDVKCIEVIFPIVGHSFIPPDRVFAQIEKRLRKKNTIVKPDEYVEVLSEFSTTCNMASNDVTIYDFKKEAEIILKPTGSWHFQFNPTKRFFLRWTKQRNVSI